MMEDWYMGSFLMQLNCIRCGHCLSEPGAILLGPPKGFHVEKYHLCIDCYFITFQEIIS